MNTSSIFLEQKRAELQVRLTILKENISSLKTQIDSQTNLSSISEKYKNGNSLAELRSYQKNALESEVQKEQATLEGLRIYCGNLHKEKENSENESEFYKKKINELTNQNSALESSLSELKSRRLLLQQEIELLQAENTKHASSKYEKEKIEQKSKEHSEYITTELDSNAKKIKLLQIKIDTLNNELRDLDNNYTSMKSECDSVNLYNDEMEKRIITLTEDAKTFDNKLFLIRREIDETKDYIASSEKEQRKLNDQLDTLMITIKKINNANIKINASLAIMAKSLEKKASFMQREQEYYDQCIQAKKKFIDELKDINSYSDLI